MHEVTSDILSCLGVNREHHDGIINTVNNVADDGRRYRFYITGKFNIVSKLSVNIRLFRTLLPYLTTTHVRQIKLLYDIRDVDVNIVHDLLANVVCDELVISEDDDLTTTHVSNMLVNVSTVANVVIDVRCHNVNIEELRNLYPAITFNYTLTPSL